MITVEDARTVASSRPKRQPKPEPKLNEDGQTALDFADAAIESIIVRDFDGGMISTTIPAESVPLEVIQALKVRYEREGGWAFGIFPRVDPRDDLVHEILLVLSPSSGAPPEAPSPERVAQLAAKVSLPAIVAAQVVAAPGDLRLLLRMPTRSRPAQSLQVLQRYREMAGMPVQIEVVLDEDDETMLSAEVIQRLVAMECHFVVGRHQSKVAACNDGRVTDWDVLALISDDMVPVVPGYARRICEAMRQHWPHLDGALHFNDGHTGQKLYTMPILGRRLHEQFQSKIYDQNYSSLWCDNEQTEVLRAMGRLTYLDEVIVEHRHPANVGGGQMDALYRRNEALWGRDEEVYKRRRETVRPHAAWGFNSPPLWLSIGILTFPARRAMLEHFLKELYGQIIRDRPRQVELIIEDNPAGSLGAKRQRVLDRALGRNIAFVDDDDWVSHDYIERVVSALESDPEADCASFVGTITTNGIQPYRFEHSLKYDKWETRDGKYVRTPNHLNAIKTSIARHVGFADITYTEDRRYSDDVRPYLKREVSIGEAPGYFYFYRSKENHAGAVS